MCGGPSRRKLILMSTFTAPTELSFLYVESDVPPGTTLREWRRDRERARREARRRGPRRFGVLRPRYV
jgi:hypothetical protein